jgi:hypothetical protein
MDDLRHVPKLIAALGIDLSNIQDKDNFATFLINY